MHLILRMRNLIIILFVLLLFDTAVFAQSYSRQDIRNLIEYFKEYDLKSRPLIMAQGARLDELIEQCHRDIKSYTSKENLKTFIWNLYDNLLAMCNALTRQTDSLVASRGFYDPSHVSEGFNKLNLEAAYLLLRIKVLGYLYQYRYKEMALDKDILCPRFYIYSTGNKVKNCNDP